MGLDSFQFEKLFNDGFEVLLSKRYWNLFKKNGTLVIRDLHLPNEWNDYVQYYFNPRTGYCRRKNPFVYSIWHPLNKYRDGYQTSENVGCDYWQLIRKYYLRMLSFRNYILYYTNPNKG
jgi:hypothetical protein